MYDGMIYTPAVDRSDRDALRDILRSAPIDELAYTAYLNAYNETRDVSYQWKNRSSNKPRTAWR